MYLKRRLAVRLAATARPPVKGATGRVKLLFNLVVSAIHLFQPSSCFSCAAHAPCLPARPHYAALCAGHARAQRQGLPKGLQRMREGRQRPQPLGLCGWAVLVSTRWEAVGLQLCLMGYLNACIRRRLCRWEAH